MSLQKLATEDPSFRVRVDQETGQTLISGMGELHLEIIVDRLLREFKVDANVGKPQVAYKETIRREVEKQAKFVRQTGGRGQYGDVKLRVSPLPPHPGSSSRTRSRVVRFPGSTFPRSKRVCERRWIPAFSPATRWSTSKSR